MQHDGSLPDGGYEHGVNPLTFIPHRNYVVELNENNKYLLESAKQELKNRYLKLSNYLKLPTSDNTFFVGGLAICMLGGVAVAHARDNTSLGVAAIVPFYGAFLAAGHYVSKFFMNRYDMVADHMDFVPSKQ